MNLVRNQSRATAVEKTPDWVPPLVVSLADAMRPFVGSAGDMHPLGQEIIDRLLADPRMELVWKTLRSADVDPGTLEALPSNLRLVNWIEASVATRVATANEEACVAFFAAAVIEFKLANKPAYASAVSELVDQWRQTALQCQSALNDPLFRPLIDGEVERSLAVVERFFEEQATFVGSGTSPYLLGRTRKNDAIRALVRAIAKKSQLIFGQFLYGTIATTVNVGLQLQNEIGPEDVRKWCEGL